MPSASQCCRKISIRITVANWIILAIREHIGAEEAVSVGGGEGVGVNEPAVGEVIVPALEVIETRFAVVVIPTVTQGVDVPDEAGLRNLRAFVIVHRIVAPRAVVVGGDERTGGIQKGNDVALRVEDVVVERRGRAVVVDHGERLVAIVIDKLERLAAPLLPHDLAGERRVGIGRITDLLAAADTSHVIGVLHGLAAHDGLRELTPFRPVEMVVTSVVVRDRVAGGRDVARLRLPLIQDILGRTVCRHAREQIRPRGVRVTKGLERCAAPCNTPDVARRIVGIEEGRLAAVLLRHQLALRVVAILLRRGRGGHVFNDALHC